MIKFYVKTRFSNFEIEAVNVVSETAKFVTKEHKNWNGETKTQREAKFSEYGRYFDTFKEAQDFAIDRIENKCKQLTLELTASARAEIAIRKMTEESAIKDM